MDNHSTSLSKKDEEALSTNLSSGGMTRRQAIQWLIAMGVSVAAANSLVAKLSEAATEIPKRGGRLRVVTPAAGIQDTLDPSRCCTESDYTRGFTFYNGLTRLAGYKIEAKPELAKSFEPNANATEWVFKLRKGVTFHDGKTLDADDVVYSIMRHKDPKVGSNAKGLADTIADVRADGKNTVIVKLHSPNGEFPLLVGTYHFMIIKNGTTDFSTAIGTGPYKVREFKPGVRSIGVRNENYFISGRPYVEEHELFGVADEMARLNALYSGDVHMNSTIPMASIPELKTRKDVRMTITRAASIPSLIMKCDRPPFNNPDLRLTIKNLFPRQKILRVVLMGYGQLGNDHIFPPDDQYYNTELPQRDVDLDKAKYHLNKAGMNNAKLELHVSGAARNSVEYAMLLQSEAARIGLTIDLKREPSAGYWSNIWRKRSFHAGSWGTRPTADLLLSLGYTSNAKWNESGYKNKRMDKLIVEARGTTDFQKRKKLYWEVQKILYEDGGSAIPVFMSWVSAVSNKVHGLTNCKTAPFGGYNYADTVWLDPQ